MIAYGQGPNKLCDDLNALGFTISREQAKKTYDTYCAVFKVAVGYLRNAGKLAATQGWLHNINGRRRWWNLPTNPKSYEERGKLASIEREGGNFMIQSVNADITKVAMILIRDYARKHKIRTKFINAVYDEIVTRTHKDDSEHFHAMKLKFMQEAGEKFVTTVPMLVDGHVAPHWLKD